MKFAELAQELVPTTLRKGHHINLIQQGRAICTKIDPRGNVSCSRDERPSSGLDRPTRPTVVDLCCGAGGFSFGFMQAGYEIKLGVDTDAQALMTFAENIQGAEVLRHDISDQDAAEAILGKLGGVPPEVVIAGPPCQGFSRAGRRDPADPRNAMLRAAARLAVRLRPKFIVFENVLYLGGPAFSKHLHSAAGVAKRAGYFLGHEKKPTILRAEAFGVPQTRRRIVLVASKVGNRQTLVAAMRLLVHRETVPGMSVAAALEGLDENSVAYNHEPMKHSQKVIDKIALIEQGGGPFSYRRLHPSRLAPTLVCGHRALPCHPTENRTLTVREAARLQGFPDSYRFLGSRSNQMQQVANAVPPNLAQGIAAAVYQVAFGKQICMSQ